MEVVAAPPAASRGAPFRDHDVREWSRIDSITGALERARLETDSWTASTNDACHKYGKVVDSRARTGADGSVQQQASRQLEVFQSRAAGAHVQVVKTKTVSSSRWSGKLDAATRNLIEGGFEDLQLPLNPLDISSQKSKASVGRSVNRRPPSRQPRNLSSVFQNDLSNPLRHSHLTAATNQHRVSRLCHQIHESAVRNAFGRKSPTVSRRGSGDGSVSGVEITEIEGSIGSNSEINASSVLARTKSTSSEDIYNSIDKDNGAKGVLEGLEELEQLQNWRRTSKVRRSLQHPKIASPVEASVKPPDLSESSVNVKKIREDLEKGRRLNTALRNNSVSANLETLDQIIQSISSTSSIERSSVDDNLDEHENEQQISKPKTKRDSFVTVESLQEVKGRLRHTSSPGSDIYKPGTRPRSEETDDGIVTEDTREDKSGRVKSYVYGMETMAQSKKPVISTGSLESRSKLVNGNSNHKNEDWYNRRKSYGFEQVHTQQENAAISLKNKKLVESSTDSGICRSNDILVVPTATKQNSRFNSDSESEQDNSNGLNGIHYGNVKKMTSKFNQEKDAEWKKGDIKSTTITIPIVKNNNVIDLSWNDEPEKETKRHSIAVDEAKYATTDTRLRKTSLIGTDGVEDDVNSNRKTKKVEFCKTEVHFAAESGKVNIVETDEKPPPTQNFRRRRRNSGILTNFNEDFNRNGLPILHFGDSSYEKAMYNSEITENNEEKTSIVQELYENVSSEESRVPAAFGVVTVNTNSNNPLDYSEEDRKQETADENIKGILKNKPTKPKPYHLGETLPFSESASDEDSRTWGVRLRHVPKDDPPIWKSTVTVHSTFTTKNDGNYNSNSTTPSSTDPPEFQKLLRNLRPIKKPDYLSDNENRYSDNLANIRVVSATKDNRRSSWSVADKNEDIQENKGYSTKINFGDGEAIVVENDQSTWPRTENLSKDSKHILNKGLVVRIGRQDSKHTLCSKTTTSRESNNSTTTTKITIDLSPSPPTNEKPQEEPSFTYTRFKRSDTLHSFKSTPLVLNTLKDQRPISKIPEQLEALKKLYEDVPSDTDSDADKEVQQLMSRITEREVDMMESDTSSIVSGSWSKMRAFRNLNDAGRGSFRAVKSRFDLKNGDIKEEKDNYVNCTDFSKLNRSYTKYSVPTTRSKFSPVVLRKTIPVAPTDLRKTGNHSSPSQIVKKTDDSLRSDKEEYFSDKEYRNIVDTQLKSKYVNENIVLRQPKKSEMTYFGVDVPSKATKNTIQTAVIKDNKISEKPDLLQHFKHTPSPTRPRKSSPSRRQSSPSSPIYENLTPLTKMVKSKYHSAREFDSSILDELTKAADQILQAVNGYTDEDCRNRLTSDEEEVRKPLDTISETKSWKNTAQDIQAKNQARMRPTLASAAKVRVKRTSSTSSVESIPKDRRKTSSMERKTATPTAKQQPEKPRKKVSSDSSSAKASTKARRLQRASSREALLQSHGSSSEDLPAIVELPHRKPRLIKKTKATQLTVSNGLELKKPARKSRTEKVENHTKSDERILGSLPEIRHKTAVSTIRSTAEKCSRDKSRTRNEESRSRSYNKRESNSKETISSSSGRPTSSSVARGHHHASQRMTSTHKESGVTQHRISTANIKKCHRSEGSRH